nr:MAG TPA: hypothetical protein [Caudoviricetes sp.]
MRWLSTGGWLTPPVSCSCVGRRGSMAVTRRGCPASPPTVGGLCVRGCGRSPVACAGGTRLPCSACWSITWRLRAGRLSPGPRWRRRRTRTACGSTWTVLSTT